VTKYKTTVKRRVIYKRVNKIKYNIIRKDKIIYRNIVKPNSLRHKFQQATHGFAKKIHTSDRNVKIGAVVAATATVAGIYFLFKRPKTKVNINNSVSVKQPAMTALPKAG
jgi:hypothetical protein